MTLDVLQCSFPILSCRFYLEELLVDRVGLQQIVVESLGTVAGKLVVVGIAAVRRSITVEGNGSDGYIRVVLHEVERLLDGSQLIGIVTEILHDIPLVDAEVESSRTVFLSDLHCLCLWLLISLVELLRRNERLSIVGEQVFCQQFLVTSTCIIADGEVGVLHPVLVRSRVSVSERLWLLVFTLGNDEGVLGSGLLGTLVVDVSLVTHHLHSRELERILTLI